MLRRLTHTTISPVAAIAAAELSAKLETPIAFSFSALHSADIAGKARAVGVLVKAGVPLPEAKELAGL